LSNYADTSFIASLYLLDAHSSRAAARMKNAVLPILITPLGELELLNAMSLRLFRRELELTAIEGAYALFEADLVEGVVQRAPLPPEAYEQAARIARRQTPQLGTRTLDVLHVASALTLNARTFYTLDRNQRALAKREGLIVP
jgi:predicted nucleic acid-binding protein